MSLDHNLQTDSFALVTGTPSDPAAEAPAFYVPPVNTRIEALSVSFRFAASGVAGDRLPYAYVQFGGVSFQNAYAKAVITANETVDVHFAIGISGEDVISAKDKQYAALAGFLMAGTDDKIGAFVADIKTGDQITNLVVRTKQWITEG